MKYMLMLWVDESAEVTPGRSDGPPMAWVRHHDRYEP